MCPNILLSNDDGIYAPGIRALAIAMDKRNWDVTIVAPRLQRSGEGKAITFDIPIRVEEISLSYRSGSTGWRTTGTPADAVIFGAYARQEQNFPPFDLVVSGINAGENCSVHSVLTSGTCAVAFESALLGLPAIAFSIDVSEELFFNENASIPGLEVAAETACTIIEKVLEEGGLPEGVAFLNVNFPATITPDTPVEICKMALTKYRDFTIKREDPRGIPYYWIWGDTITVPEDTDVFAVLTKKITSVTPITLDLDARNAPKIKTELEYLINL
ncbi:MAG: 5'/3'-nucleotidase SurE [Candidatus Heimdallarchaeota archaeon]